ncbi:MAG: universal stress protein [Deltaproteobacteria bacterium]|nr:universal stress protein [Deltaproteobacteria bacterium]
MNPIKKIMVAVGFTEYAEGLLSYAARIAEIMNAELLIVNIINVRDVEAVGSIAAMGYDVDSESYVSGIKEERRQVLDKILAKIALPADKMRTIFQIGHPVEELLKIAMRENVDLMVMGIKGRTDLEHILVGSVAEKIFRRSPVPILSYRDEKNAARLKKHIGFK